MWSKRGPAECCDLDWLESTGHFLDEFDESTSNLTAHFERADELFPRWIFIINPVWIKFWLVRSGCNLKITHKFFNKVVSSFIYHFCNLWSALPVSNTPQDTWITENPDWSLSRARDVPPSGEKPRGEVIFNNPSFWSGQRSFNGITLGCFRRRLPRPSK